MVLFLLHDGNTDESNPQLVPFEIDSFLDSPILNIHSNLSLIHFVLLLKLFLPNNANLRLRLLVVSLYELHM